MLSNFTIQITLLDITAVKGRHSFENYDPPSPELNCFLHCVMVVSLFSPLFRLWFTSLWWLVLSYLAQKMAYPKTIHFLCIFKGRWSKKYSSFVQNWTFLNCLTGFANKIPFYWSTMRTIPYVTPVDICWHLDNHLPTSSCKCSLWTTP